MQYEGYNGQVEVDEAAKTVTVTRKGALGRVSAGKVGPRVIPFETISDVRVQAPTRMTNGHIVLGLAGATAAACGRGEAARHPDTVIFTWAKREALDALTGQLRAVVEENTRTGVDFTAAASAPAAAPAAPVKAAKKAAPKKPPLKATDVAPVAEPPAETAPPATAARTRTVRTAGTASTASSPAEPVPAPAALTPAQQRAAKREEKAEDKLTQAHERYSAGGERPDIAEAAARMRWTFGGKRELKKLSEHLVDAEKVTFIAQGTYTKHQGIVVLTTERLVFVFHGFIDAIVEDFPLNAITSVGLKKGFGTGTLVVHVAGAATHIEGVVNADLKHLVDSLRAVVTARSTTPSVAAPATAAPDTFDQLAKLADLLDRGVLTDEEFATQKAKLLG